MNLTKWKKTLGAALAVLVFAGLAAGCGSDKKQAADKKELTFSKSQGPYSDLFEKGVKPILEKKGYKITGKDMSDLLQADIALNEGEVDFNVEQHTAYMENFNKKQGGHLVALTPIPTVPELKQPSSPVCSPDDSTISGLISTIGPSPTSITTMSSSIRLIWKTSIRSRGVILLP